MTLKSEPKPATARDQGNDAAPASEHVLVRMMIADHSPAHQIHSINSQTARRHPRSAAFEPPSIAVHQAARAKSKFYQK